MEPGGGGGGGGSHNFYYSSFARVASAGGRPVEVKAGGRALGPVEAGDAASCWRRAIFEGAPARGPGRRPVSAFAPCSNLKIFLERDLSKERHELLKDQRLFRNRARKHSIETNKRRRALEEKWKENEEKEQKFREQILLQRKLKHQEATEKFQRGHLSSSQQKKGVQRKAEYKLDDAVEQFQGTGLLWSSSRLSGRIINTAPSASTNSQFHWKRISTKTGCDRITQENNRAKLDSDQLAFQQNMDEMQQKLQEQHFESLQSFHQEMNEIAHAESVCSEDSLESRQPNENNPTSSEASSLSAQLDSSLHKSQELQTKNKTASEETDTTISKTQHVNNWLINLNTSNFKKTSPFHDILIKYNVVTAEEQTFNSDQKPSVLSTSDPRDAEICTSDDNLTCAQNKIEDQSFLLTPPSSGTVGTESLSASDGPLVKSDKFRDTPDPPPVASTKEKTVEPPQNNRISSAEAASRTTATPGDLPTVNYNNGFLISCLQKVKESCVVKCPEDVDYVMGAKADKYSDHINSEACLVEETHKGSLDQQTDNGEHRVTEVTLSVPHGDLMDHLPDQYQQGNDADERKGVKLPKSILKKESKYEPGCFSAVVINRGIRFGQLPMSSVRDSVELAKIKGKDADVQKNGKKLRWFDEIPRLVGDKDDEKLSEQSITEIPQGSSQSPALQIKAAASRTNLRNIPSYTFSSGFLENHHNRSPTPTKIPTAGDSERDTETLRPFISTAYHVAKQAWMAPKGEEIKPLLCFSEFRNLKNNPRKGRPKMIKRPKSAKAPSTFIPKNRKGAIIRPQSASEATKAMKTQGKIVVPHPPILGKKMDQSAADLKSQSANLFKFHADNESGHFSVGSHFLPECQDLNRDAIEDPLPTNIACHSHMVTMRSAQPPYSVFAYEPLTKTNCTVQSIAQYNSYTKRNPVYSESGLCFDHTPTDEEIAVLWQGVHNALVQKDGAAGDSQSALHCSSSNNGDLQSSRLNVSHITIDGGNLKDSAKSGVRVNGFFSSQPSTAVAISRRKQNNDNNENKRKALLEQRRQMAASAGWKPSLFGQTVAQAMKLGPYQSGHEPAQSLGGISHSEEVSDSVTQFLLAENLANTTATEGEILTSLNTGQPQYKQTVLLNRPQRTGMSALSLEEHKVLQSLDRLNQRLQNVQENISKNPSSTSFLQTISPLITSPSYMDVMPSMHRYRNVSADTRTLTQRRY